jgi:hypothetical protein
MAPLQKRALWGLIVGLALTVAFILVFFLMGGIDVFDKMSISESLFMYFG